MLTVRLLSCENVYIYLFICLISSGAASASAQLAAAAVGSQPGSKSMKDEVWMQI